MKTSLAALVLACVLPHAVADTHDVFGTFLTVDKDSHVTISDCGDGTPCGTIVWLDPNTLDAGITPETAMAKDGRPIIGLELLQGFEKQSTDWRGGNIYSPEEGKTYASRMKRLENGDLQLKGCVGPFCQTQIWTPVE